MNIQVEGGGSVELISSTGGDLSVANVARVSFNRSTDELSQKDKGLINYLWENEHTSPFRHSYFTFRIKCPIFVLRQWQKHQVGCAWNEASGRYIEFENETHVISSWREQIKNVKQGSGGGLDSYGQQSSAETYREAINNSFEAYESLLREGVCREQARMVLPLSLMTHSVWSASLQAVMHFLKLRLDSHAQYEIRKYAEAVLQLCEEADNGSFRESLSKL